MSMFAGISNKIQNTYRGAYSGVFAPHKDSKFIEKGVLTPSEFLVAGDQLVQMCPTWQWKSAVDAKYRRIEFPEDNQFLYTRVICHKRVEDSINCKTVEHNLEEEFGDGWAMAEVEDINKENEEIIDDNNNNTDFVVVGNGSQIRFYELTITYDFYYTTPRFWLVGYTEDNVPLSYKEMFEDITADYANKTVTYETHPYLGTNQLSIHPCKHANVMKHFIDIASENGVNIEVSQAMFIFLKFIASVMPTMEYDLSINIDFSSHK